MLLSCRRCHKEYVASKNLNGEYALCNKCRTLSRAIHKTKLGLHPALEKKWAESSTNIAKHRVESGGVSYTKLGGGDLKRNLVSDPSATPVIPGFDISYQVGQGAMGCVYRAREIKTGRLVAIKVLSRDLSLRPDLVARFEREAYALKALKNNNVVSIIDAGKVDDTHYFVMEFIEGITLRARINHGIISFEEASFITAQILLGLMAAHNHGIIHRDLKPENVLLYYPDSNFTKPPERVVLVDFGLVGIGGLAFDPHPNLTRSKVTMGTVNYMAPEQHVDAKRVDHRSDLYSAGVMLFEMISGDLPLGRYLMPAERGMQTPIELDLVLAKALSRTIDERYLDAKEFFEDLNKVCDARNVTLCPKKSLHNNSLKPLKSFFKSHLFELRYIVLLVVSSLFFVYGIKLSLGKPASSSIEAPLSQRDMH